MNTTTTLNTTLLNTTTLRPGLLVNLKTSIRGNVNYRSRTIEANRFAGTARETWETTKTVQDVAEFEAAKRARMDAVKAIRSACTWTSFGLLCPENNASKLAAAIEEARSICRAFNNTARVTRISIYPLTGRIEPSDENAVRAITSEVRDLMAEMESGISNMDVKVIRDAANKARSIGSMLTPETEARVKVAIEAARSVARNIVKSGEQAAMEVDKVAIRKIAEQRAGFLDLDDVQAVQAPVAVARGIDLMPEQSEQPKRKVTKAAVIDLD